MKTAKQLFQDNLILAIDTGQIDPISRAVSWTTEMVVEHVKKSKPNNKITTKFINHWWDNWFNRVGD